MLAVLLFSCAPSQGASRVSVSGVTLSYLLHEWIFFCSLPSFLPALPGSLLHILEFLFPLCPFHFIFGISLTVSNPDTCLPGVFSLQGCVKPIVDLRATDLG